MKSVLAMLLIIIALNVADVWTTTQILRKGGKELNPIFAEINEQTIALKMGFIFFASIFSVRAYQQAVKENSKVAKGIIWAVLIAITVFYIYVVFNNTTVMFNIERTG